ncbi:MAG: single-stranded DNA-binding protein [Candidatus Vogelbacteria bacterium]|nr:single-stranded DNA-binding protein [Candidatus Vogelbacteria bacterium]
MYFNKAIIIGNLTKDPEMRSMPSGAKVVTLGVATDRVWKDKTGNKQQATEYHNVVVFGKQAETSAQYLKKGQTVLVEGRIQTRSWDGADGVKKYKTEIVADRVQFGPKNSSGGFGGSPHSSTASSIKGGSGPGEAESDQIEYPSEEINPEDIPF